MAYEATKMEDRATAARCHQLGIKLIPMVAETFGGWGPAAQKVFSFISRATAEKQGITDSAASRQLYQALGVKLQRANARAIIARVAGSSNLSTNSAFATTSLSEAALVLTGDTLRWR